MDVLYKEVLYEKLIKQSMIELENKVLKMKGGDNDELSKNSLPTDNSTLSNLRIIKNLLILSIGFLFLFSAFMALANLQSTMNNVGSVGVASQSAIYGALIVSGFFLPKLLIKKFGCKLILVVSVLTYSPYIAANFYPTMWTLLPTAILLGAGGANLWSAASSYINELSFMDARGDEAKATLSTSKFFGIFMMFFQTTQIWGNLVSYYVLSPSDIILEIHKNMSEIGNRDENVTCGADFCGGIDQKLSPPSDSKRFMLIGIYFAFSIIAAAVLLFFLDSLKQENKENNATSLLQNLTATFNHMKKTEQLLLIVLSTFTGLEQGFVFADYSEAYVACALGLQNVGLVFVCFGITNAITSISAGRLLKYIPRTAMMMVAAASNTGVCIALYFWKPRVQQISIFYILVSFWGVSDAIWQTQISALYGVLFRSDEEAAFASYRLLEGVGYLIAFSCNSQLCTSSKIYMQIGFLIVGMAGYIALEIRTKISKNKISTTTVL